MALPIGYLPLLIAIAGVVFVLICIVLFRDRWNTTPTRLRAVLGTRNPRIDPVDLEELAALLLYEESYPAFSELLGLVLSRFPLERLQRKTRFRENLAYLAEATLGQASQQEIEDAMCRVIGTLLEDPDVEYYCRPELQTLIDRFIHDLEQKGRGERGCLEPSGRNGH